MGPVFLLVLVVVTVGAIVAETKVEELEATSEHQNQQSSQLNLTSIVSTLDRMVSSGSMNITFLEEISERNKFLSNADGYQFLAKTLTRGFFYITEDDMPKLLNTITNMLPVPKSSISIFHDLFRKTMSSLQSIKSYQNNDWIIKSWRPFENNIIGMGLSKDNTGHISHIKDIYKNESASNINVTGLEVAGYVPYEFLERLVETNLDQNRENLTIVLVIILNPEKFKQIWDLKEDADYIIGVNIQNFCKYEDTILLKAFFKTAAQTSPENWIEFGRNYTDPHRYIKRLCFLSEMLFFSRLNVVNSIYFESVKYDFCNSTYSGEITPFRGNDLRYQGDFCMSKYLTVPKLTCNDIKSQRINQCHRDHSVTDQTKRNYERMLLCLDSSNYNYCSDTYLSIINSNLSYLDAAMAALVFGELADLNSSPFQENTEDLLNEGLRKGIISIEKEKTSPPIIYLIVLLDLFTNFYNPLKDALYVYPNFASLKSYIYPPILNQSLPSIDDIVIGMVLYRNNESVFGYVVRPLVTANATLKYSSDDNVDAITFIANKEIVSEKMSTYCNWYVIHNNITGYKNHTRQSKMLGVRCSRALNITSYLRVDDKVLGNAVLNQGYSTTFGIKASRYKVFYIAEPKDRTCDPAAKISIFNQNIPVFVLRSVLLANNKTGRDIGVLSHLTISVNAESEKALLKHATNLKVIASILSTLSILCVICILMSAVTIKDWYKQRIYSLQLTIAVACETVFFLLNDNYISQTGYVIFYFFLLAQFSWMLLIGYMQYVRYIKIFEYFTLGKLKALILGWISPAVIVGISMLTHLECFNCSFCSKNSDIFFHFVLIPSCFVILSNLVIYIFVMVKIARSKSENFSDETKKAKKRAALLLPFVMGIFWIFIMALIIPSIWIAVVGSYIFQIVASSQGLVVFIFVILCDECTRNQWFSRLKISRKQKMSVSPS